MPYVTYKDSEITCVSCGKSTDIFDLVVTENIPSAQELNVTSITAFLYCENSKWKFIYVHPNRTNNADTITDANIIKILCAGTNCLDVPAKPVQDNKYILTNQELTAIKSILPQDTAFASNIIMDGVSFVADDHADLIAFKDKQALIKSKLQLLKDKRKAIEDLMPTVVATPTAENQTALETLVTERDTLVTELDNI